MTSINDKLGKKQLFTAVAKHTFTYRFTCEQCNEQTEWYPITVVRIQKGELERGTTKKQAAKALGPAADEALAARIDEIRAETEAGEYPAIYLPRDPEHTEKGKREALFTQYECPKCGAVQSWGVDSATRINPIIAVVAGLIAAAIVFMLVPKDAGWILYALAIVAFVAIGALTAVIGRAALRKRASEKIAACPEDKRQIPEINWNGR